MLLRELTFSTPIDEGLVWARRGKQVVRKYRCLSGYRKGRIVANAAQCFKAPDIKKRANIKRLKARMGNRLVRKTKRTKRTNPASVRVQKMNKASRGR